MEPKTKERLIAFRKANRRLPRRRLDIPVEKLDFRKLLEHIGQSGELIAKARESLASLSRLLAFAQQSTVPMTPEVRTRLRTSFNSCVTRRSQGSNRPSGVNSAGRSDASSGSFSPSAPIGCASSKPKISAAASGP